MIPILFVFYVGRGGIQTLFSEVLGGSGCMVLFRWCGISRLICARWESVIYIHICSIYVYIYIFTYVSEHKLQCVRPIWVNWTYVCGFEICGQWSVVLKYDWIYLNRLGCMWNACVDVWQYLKYISGYLR